MGQALYRKYRSKKLDEVVGQDHITSTLKNALKTGKINHAYLFTGPRGVGKTSVARILAHEVNGFKYNEDNYHLDIIEIDAASNRRIDEIRDLRDKVHIAPTSGKYKIYIIDEVHMLTKEAFNALLKTLEEPPEHVIFILATTESHKLPETIISRTQRFSFKPIENFSAVEHLRTIAKNENIQIDDEALSLIAEHGEGSFRDSISLLDQVSTTSGKVTVDDVRRLLGIAPTKAIDELLIALVNGSPKEVVDCLNSLFEQGYSAANIAKQIAHKLRSQLIEGQTEISAQAATKLLKTLIDIPSSSKPERMLELVLLEVALESEPSNHKPAQAPVKVAKTEIKVKPIKPAETDNILKNELKTESQTATDNQFNNNQGFDLELWNQILPTMKKQHSTLYSILRMGEPSYADGTLTLSFKFVFHQKRVNESKNRKIIDDYIRQHTDAPIKLVAIIAPTKSKAKTTNTEDKTVLKNISNIFGSAEVLDS
jgi:DNA polymerase III subunit gamma/tau